MNTNQLILIVIINFALLLLAIFLITKKSEPYSFKNHIRNIFTLTNLTLPDYILLTIFFQDVILLKTILLLFVYPLMLVIFIKSRKSLRVYAEQQIKKQYKDDPEIDTFISNKKTSDLLQYIIYPNGYNFFLPEICDSNMIMIYDLYIIGYSFMWFFHLVITLKHYF